MTTQASVKLQSDTGDAILLYTRYDGYQKDILEWGSNLEEKWNHTLKIIEELIHGKEAFYPLISRWCNEMNNLLLRPNTLEKYGNLLTSMSLRHLHLSQHRVVDSSEKEMFKNAKNQLKTDYSININSHGTATMNTTKPTKIKPGIAKNVISIQGIAPDYGNIPIKIEYLYQTSQNSEKDVIDDILNLPLFFRELSLLLRSRELDNSCGEESILNSIFKDVESLRSHPDRPSFITLEQMFENLPFSSSFINIHDSSVGHHLSFFRPLHYNPAPVSAYITEPNRLITLSHASSDSAFLHKFRIQSTTSDNENLKATIHDSVKESNSKRNDIFSLAGVNPGHVETSSGDHGSEINYGSDVVKSLFSIANLKQQEWVGIIESNTLKQKFFHTTSTKNNSAL